MKHKVKSIHFVGIGGAGMSGIAEVLVNLGYQVSGSDLGDNAATRRLKELGARVMQGHAAENVQDADAVVTSTAVKGDNPEVIAARARQIPVVPRAQMLAELMRLKQGIAIAGTHGKTTTTSLLAWVLDHAGLNPGFLVGGVPEDFGVSARLTDSPFFVIEADEYDTAFCDKRSKFVHYRPRTAILNNLEFDHADIFADLSAIETQFHHLVRTLPGQGLIVANAAEESLKRVIAKGCWTPIEWFNADGAWHATAVNGDGFQVWQGNTLVGETRLALPGAHNHANALAALLAARHAGVPVAQGLSALEQFKGVKRRLEVKGCVRGITVYDDFAHHPTAIAATLGGLRGRVGRGRILAVLEPRSNTMKLGTMKSQLPLSLAAADRVFCYSRGLSWNPTEVLAGLGTKARTFDDLAALVAAVVGEAGDGDHVLVMSNGGFGGVHGLLLKALADRTDR